MNRLQRWLLRAVGVKSLYDLHPELLDRQHVWRAWSDEEQQHGGFQGNAQDYGCHVWVRKACDVIIANISGLPMEVQRADTGEPLDRHPLAMLLANPNPRDSAAELWRQWALNMLLGGECGGEVVFNGAGKPAEIWMCNPDEFEVRVDRAKARYGGVLGYRIGQDYELPSGEFAHWMFYNPLNVYRGIAPIAAVRMGILIDQFAQAWSRLFFTNAARPDFAVITPQGLTKPERDEIEARLTAKFGGVENAHRPIVLEQGVTDIKTFSFAPQDIQWLEQRKLSREEIGACLGVPDEMMGWGRDTYENFGQAERVLWRLTLVPLIRLRDDVLNQFFRGIRQLAAGEVIATDLSGVQALAEDRTSKGELAAKFFAMGYPVNLLNDSLGLGLGHIEGGDVGYLPLALVPVTRIPGAPTPPAKMLKSGPRVPYGGQLHQALWRLFKAAIDEQERSLLRRTRRALQEQQNRVAQAVRAGETDVARVFDVEEEERLWAEGLREAYAATVAAGGKHGLDQLGLDLVFDVTNPRVREAIERTLWDFTREVTYTTQQALAEVLRRAVDEGQSIPQLSDAISELYEGFKGARAELIARTESLKAFNLGTMEGYQQARVEKRGWLSTMDPPRAREEHMALHGTELPMSEPFDVDGAMMMYPGDPAGPPEQVCNCRCTIYPVVEV